MQQNPDCEISEEVKAGQAVYSRRTLAVYDLIVLGISNRFIWKCPTERILALYNTHVTNNHLDVGVGTGFFLDHCRFPSEQPRLALLDLNKNCLDATAQRVSRYSPEIIQANLLEPINGERKFDSVGINYVLHCLPGALPEKAIVFDHLKKLMNPGAVLFGSTLLSDGVKRGFLAQRLAEFYNRKGIFSNRQDSLHDLQEALKSRFTESDVETIGSAALFWGRI